MLNKRDPLIDSVRKVMEQNDKERAAIKSVNEKFGVQDRKALPREKQGAWDAAYKTVISEGVVNTAPELEESKKSRDKDTEKMDEELKGNQHRIDANKNNKVDAHDFKLLQAKKMVKKRIAEGFGGTESGSPIDRIANWFKGSPKTNAGISKLNSQTSQSTPSSSPKVDAGAQTRGPNAASGSTAPQTNKVDASKQTKGPNAASGQPTAGRVEPTSAPPPAQSTQPQTKKTAPAQTKAAPPKSTQPKTSTQKPKMTMKPKANRLQSRSQRDGLAMDSRNK